eukprot:TRINITY_DN13532_c0_g1_i4.p1 TRINITY_DN13532_c0_g1~~TRINITY_DN13532_c0_g1_i4.p1  ORF type:complete len:147 (-),score=12.84 TRINITY_DN13532_c0_g1_i4:99-539(-)
MTIPRAHLTSYPHSLTQFKECNVSMDYKKTLKRSSRNNNLANTAKDVFSLGKENLGKTYATHTQLDRTRNPLRPLPIRETFGVNEQTTPNHLKSSRWWGENTPMTCSRTNECLDSKLNSHEKVYDDLNCEDEFNQATFRASQVNSI